MDIYEDLRLYRCLTSPEVTITYYDNKVVRMTFDNSWTCVL